MHHRPDFDLRDLALSTTNVMQFVGILEHARGQRHQVVTGGNRVGKREAVRRYKRRRKRSR